MPGSIWPIYEWLPKGERWCNLVVPANDEMAKYVFHKQYFSFHVVHLLRIELYFVEDIVAFCVLVNGIGQRTLTPMVNRRTFDAIFIGGQPALNTLN